MLKSVLLALAVLGFAGAAQAQSDGCYSYDNCSSDGAPSTLTSQQLNAIIQSFWDQNGGTGGNIGAGDCSGGLCEDNTDREACEQSCMYMYDLYSDYCRGLADSAQRAVCWGDAANQLANCMASCQ